MQDMIDPCSDLFNQFPAQWALRLEKRLAANSSNYTQDIEDLYVAARGV
jgi:hypothetical protein